MFAFDFDLCPRPRFRLWEVINVWLDEWSPWRLRRRLVTTTAFIDAMADQAAANLPCSACTDRVEPGRVCPGDGLCRGGAK